MRTPAPKALRQGTSLTVNEGVFTIDSSDDSLHSNGDLTLTGGTFDIASGDDGMHADSSLMISGGTVGITKSYEGIEGMTVTISGGTISLTASDDGVNSAGGSDGSSLNGRPGQNGFAAVNTDCFVSITGGVLTIDASGDGLIPTAVSRFPAERSISTPDGQRKRRARLRRRSDAPAAWSSRRAAPAWRWDFRKILPVLVAALLVLRLLRRHGCHPQRPKRKRGPVLYAAKELSVGGAQRSGARAGADL